MRKLHNKGPKKQRDWAYAVAHYKSVAKFARAQMLSDKDLATLSPQIVYKMAESVYDIQLSAENKRKYAEWAFGKTNPKYRLKPWAFRWFWYELKIIRRAPWYTLIPEAIKRYPKFRKAKRDGTGTTVPA